MEAWETEPDEKRWEHAGFRCHIWRHPTLGHLCGYIHIPEGHPWWGKDYDDITVHGGLTYAEKDKEGEWWIGFDTAHLGDLVPNMPLSFNNAGTYRDMNYLTAETQKLADQAREAGNP